MEAFQFLLQGFALAATPVNLLFALIGAVLGTMVGVLPGLGQRRPSPSSCRSPTPSGPR